MRILVAGAGATGGYFGARLAEAGRDVSFLVRPARADALRRDGLQVVSPHGNVTLAPKLVLATEIAEPFDVVLLAVKAYALEPALADLAPAVGPRTMILPVLNGMRHLDRLIARFGEAPVLGGVCVVATMLDPAGRIVQLADMQELAYGERDGSASPRLQALDGALRDAGFGARLSATILQDMWEKWMLLAATGALTCLLQGTVGEIEAVPGGAALARRILAECASVAAASGFAPREAFMARASGMLTAKGSGFASSMYRDMAAGAPVEVEHVLADMAERGRAQDVPVPLLEAAVARLRVYQNRVMAAAV